MVVQEAQNLTWFVLNYSHNNYYNRVGDEVVIRSVELMIF